MKKSGMAVLLILIATGILAQEISIQELEIEKPLPGDDDPGRLTLVLAVITDVSDFSFKLDDATTSVREIKDDTGHDLLKEHEAYWNTIDWREPDPLVRMDGEYSMGDREGFKMEIKLDAAPAKGARNIMIKGSAGMINAGEETSTYTLKNVPTSHEYGAPGMQTELGELYLSDQGRWFGKYYQLRVENQSPIVSVTVKGGDDREAFIEAGGSVKAADIIFIEKPDEVDLEIVARETEIETVTIDLEVKVGF